MIIQYDVHIMKYYILGNRIKLIKNISVALLVYGYYYITNGIFIVVGIK